MPNKVVAPWNPLFVGKLNAFQADPRYHQYTCEQSYHRPLVATLNGWICEDCSYTQDWAHGWEWFD